MAAITSAVIAGASAVSSYTAGKKSAKAQKKANRAQRDINRMRNRQAQRAFLREFRQAQAASIAGAVFQGIGLEGSTVQGQLSSQNAQRITAMNEFAEMNRLGDTMTKQMNRATNYGFKATTFGQIGSLAMSFASFAPKETPVTTTTSPTPRTAVDFQGREINYGN